MDVRIRAVAARRLALVALLIGLAPAPAAAAPISCPQFASLDDLIALGSEGCLGGHGRLFDFRYAIVGAGGATEVAASEIAVEFPAVRFGQGVLLIGNWAVDPGQSLDVLIEFGFADLRVTGAGVDILPWDGVVPHPAATIEGWLCAGAAFSCDGDNLIHLAPRVTMPSPLLEGSIEALLSLSGAVPDERIFAPSIHVGLSVPEPSMALLVACGIGVHRLCAARRGRVRPVA